MDEQEDVVFEESTEEGEAISGAAKVKKLQDKIKLLEKEKQEYLDGWQRSRADYANLQKTTEEDKKRLRAFIEEGLLEEFLPVADSFAMAMSNKDAWEKVDPAWRTGVEYIHQQLMNVLREHNLESFGKVGDMFDPSFHQAVSEVATEDLTQDHSLASVLQQGYKLGDTILRPARVSVYKATL